MVKVAISPQEFSEAVAVGMARFVASSTAGHNHASTYARDCYKRLEEETVGAVGELAVSKHFGDRWTKDVNTFHGKTDVPSGEVRATRLDNGSLIIRDNDADERWFFLVTGTPPVVEIRGYILGRNAKRPEFLKDPHGNRKAWFVPQGALMRLKEDR